MYILIIMTLFESDEVKLIDTIRFEKSWKNKISVLEKFK